MRGSVGIALELGSIVVVSRRLRRNADMRMCCGKLKFIVVFRRNPRMDTLEPRGQLVTLDHSYGARRSPLLVAREENVHSDNTGHVA